MNSLLPLVITMNSLLPLVIPKFNIFEAKFRGFWPQKGGKIVNFEKPFGTL